MPGRTVLATFAFVPPDLLMFHGQDITERKQAEEELRESEERYRNVFERHAAVKLLIDPDTGSIIEANQAAVNYYGWSREQLKQMKIQEINTLPPEDVKKEMEKARTEKRTHFEFRHRRADGSIRDVGVFGSNIEVKGKNLLHSIVHDITDRKEAEEAQRESEQKYRTIFENAVEGIFQSTLDGRYLNVNPALASMYGFETPEEMIRSVSDKTNLYVDPGERKRLIEQILEQGIVIGYEVERCRRDGSRFWASMNVRVIRDGQGKALYYEGTVEDITSRKLAEETLRQSAEKLRKSLIGTIRAISSTVETRDPYTAGHQRRVSSLARVIAQEMGLPNDTVDTIRMVGSIHDIGKISVPAEILSKPGKLTDMEFGLIKVHSQSGYDILKDAELPYPIAEVVLQHHERLDGSGYPQGLKDDQILLETRIISVADVVEAIASYRPYRPARGIDAALEEIEKNKGILYDTRVVEACLRLFRERGFKFE
jgi:PAS domain S-box-containing protein